MRKMPLALFFLLYPIFANSQQQIVGHWEGKIVLAGGELQIGVEFVPAGDSLRATIDIPQQAAMGLRLSSVWHRPPKLHFELPAGPGLAVFDGTLAGDSVNGEFRQAGFTGTFLLKKQPAGAQAGVEPPPPYKVEEVAFQNGPVTLAGTLTVPSSNGKHPALILITGSGAQNRDEDVFGFKVFRVLADSLTRRGVAVLRCDDRGVGGSTGDIAQSTTEDFAGDVGSGLGFLKSRDDINPRQIGLLGHSEGADVAGLAASRLPEIAFVILMAGPAVPGGRIILSQIESLGKARGMPDDRIARDVALEKRVLEVVRADAGWDNIKAEIRDAFREEMKRGSENLPADQKKMLPNIDSLAEARAEAQLAAAKSRWFRHFIDYDPAVALSEVRCPVFALFGGKDMQVQVSLNAEAMETALRRAKNADVSVRVLPGANHLFQEAGTGAPSEYAMLKKEFIPGFVETLFDWMAKRVTIIR